MKGDPMTATQLKVLLDSFVAPEERYSKFVSPRGIHTIPRSETT